MKGDQGFFFIANHLLLQHTTTTFAEVNWEININFTSINCSTIYKHFYELPIYILVLSPCSSTLQCF